MRRVVILQGVSGAGKSSYIKKYYPQNRMIYSADDFFETGRGYVFDPKLLPKAHDQCLRKYIAWFTWNDQNKDVAIVDNTNTTPTEIAPYYAIAQAYDVPVKIISLEIDPAIAVKRNIHNVPERTIYEQHTRIQHCHLSMPKFWKIEKVKEG